MSDGMAGRKPGRKQNLLRPKRDQTAEERRESASKAGVASGRARRERRAMQQLARIVLDMPYDCQDDELDELEATCFEDFPDRHLTVGERSLLAVAKRAMRGDTVALAFLRDTAGERPADRVEVSGDVERASREIAAMVEAERARGDGGA